MKDSAASEALKEEINETADFHQQLQSYRPSALFALTGSICSAQTQPPKVLDQPATVISHLTLNGAAVTGIGTRQRQGRQYLFLENAGQPGLVVVDITKPKAPVPVKDVNLPKDIESGSF